MILGFVDEEMITSYMPVSIPNNVSSFNGLYVSLYIVFVTGGYVYIFVIPDNVRIL